VNGVDVRITRSPGKPLMLLVRMASLAGPTVGMAAALARRLPDAELKVVAGLGTFFFIEDPDRFRALAGPFLERHGAG
jgi:pimeloyl-ACP methyl ester carboxylesterase